MPSSRQQQEWSGGTSGPKLFPYSPTGTRPMNTKLTRPRVARGAANRLRSPSPQRAPRGGFVWGHSCSVSSVGWATSQTLSTKSPTPAHQGATSRRLQLQQGFTKADAVSHWLRTKPAQQGCAYGNPTGGDPRCPDSRQGQGLRRGGSAKVSAWGSAAPGRVSACPGCCTAPGNPVPGVTASGPGEWGNRLPPRDSRPGRVLSARHRRD